MKKKFISFSNKRSKPILVLFALTLLIIFGFQISDLKALSYFSKDGELYAEGLIEGTKSGKALVLPNATYVGIGTGSPSALLHLEQQSGELVLRLKNNTQQTGRNWEFNSKPNGDLSIIDRTAIADRLLINSSGNVGIGTGSLPAKFQVGGGAYISGDTLMGGVLGVGGAIPSGNELFKVGSSNLSWLAVTSNSGIIARGPFKVSTGGIEVTGNVSATGEARFNKTPWGKCYNISVYGNSTCKKDITLACQNGYFISTIVNEGGSNSCIKEIECCSLGTDYASGNQSGSGGSTSGGSTDGGGYVSPSQNTGNRDMRVPYMPTF